LLIAPPPNGETIGTLPPGTQVVITADEGLGYYLVEAPLGGEQRLGFVASHAIRSGIDTTPPEVATHRGDPVGPPEILSQTAKGVSEIHTAAIKNATPTVAQTDGGGSVRRPAARLFAEQLLKTAKAEIGVSRATNRARVSAYLELFGLKFAYSNGTVVPFCAAGVGWAICKSYCDLQPQAGDAFEPIAYTDSTLGSALKSVFFNVNSTYCALSAGCDLIVNAAHATHRWNAPSVVPKPGWLILYNWNGGKSPEHVGIVEQATANSLTTIEFNTTAVGAGSQGNGGAVARRDRQAARHLVVGYVATY
jgi:hypothetical protein